MKTVPLGMLICYSVFSSVCLYASSLTFDGLQSGEQILNYYNGGLGGDGSGPGPSDGVYFSNGLAESPTVIAFGPSAVLTASSVTMDLTTPYGGPVSFYYQGNGSVTFYSGLNGTGSVVGLATLANGPGGFPFGQVESSFQSAVFTETSPSLYIDSITFGGGLVIPEPASAALAMSGLALSCLVLLRVRSRI